LSFRSDVLWDCSGVIRDDEEEIFSSVNGKGSVCGKPMLSRQFLPSVIKKGGGGAETRNMARLKEKA
jgi:hypothetical protein